MDQAMDESMTTGSSESPSSTSGTGDDVFVSVPRVSLGHHHHHHHHRHGHHHHHHHGHHHYDHGHVHCHDSHHLVRIGECSRPANVPGEPVVTVTLGDLRNPRDDIDGQIHGYHGRHRNGNHHIPVNSRHGDRKVFKSLKRKNLDLRRAHRARHLKEDLLYRALLRRYGSRDQPGITDSGAQAVEDRHGFPSHLLEDKQDMEGLEANAMGCTFLEYVERALREVRERGWSPSLGTAEAVAETFAARSQLQQLLSRRHGRRGRHHRKHHRRCHHEHHRDCANYRHWMSSAFIDVYLQRVAQQLRTANRVDGGAEAPAAPAAVPAAQPPDEAGPSATYEEKLAEGLIPAPED